MWCCREGRELSAGYTHVWAKPGGSYILTNDPQFDASAARREGWEQMQKPVNK